ncbi:MAG: hypothetical protein JOY64_19565 [Alphaproteobacteria bacterium]|nr:hypothetical protein [Alphaproteobacteria bacterium]MBV8409836.1 hypothetical protein [Alphaproteobacteria bacterium]
MPAEAPRDDAWSMTIAAALLRRGVMVHTASLILTIVALLTGVGLSFVGAKPGPAWLVVGAAVVVLGFVEFWLAGRVALDAELLSAIAAKGCDLDGFDGAMQTLGLMPSHKASRPIGARIRGALRLFKLQGLALVAQIAVLLAGALLA